MDDAAMILVAVGANLPGPWGTRPVDTCRRAARELACLPGLTAVAVSRWYRAAPVPASSQPDYANGVVRLSGAADPAVLLATLQALERQAGRTRSVANAARTLDLDIIDIDGAMRASPDPVLPHPRVQDRAFVLLPLRDVAPDWVHPSSQRSISELLDAMRKGCGDERQPLDWPVVYK